MHYIAATPFTDKGYLGYDDGVDLYLLPVAFTLWGASAKPVGLKHLYAPVDNLAYRSSVPTAMTWHDEAR